MSTRATTRPRPQWSRPPLSLARKQLVSKGLTVHEIYQRDAEGVAFIRSQIVQQTQSVFGFPQQQQSTATGSGFLIDNDGHILTNAHVVQGAKSVDVQLGDGDSQQAQVVGTDPSMTSPCSRSTTPRE